MSRPPRSAVAIAALMVSLGALVLRRRQLREFVAAVASGSAEREQQLRLALGIDPAEPDCAQTGSRPGRGTPRPA